MVKLIKVWVTDDQYAQLQGKLKPYEVVTLLTLRKLGVEWKDQREALEFQEFKTRREMERKPQKMEIRVEGALRDMGPMTTPELGKYLGLTRTTNLNRYLKQSSRIIKVAERKTSNGPGRPAAVWGLGDN